MQRKTSHIATLLLLTATLATKKIQAQWDIEDSNSTASLRGIHNAGGGVAWASGTNGTVLRTEDGGYLWQTCTIPPGAEKLDFRGIQAFDENTAIVMSSGKGDLSRLYKTTDGCQTWKLLFTNPDKEGFWDAIQFHAFDSLYPRRLLKEGGGHGILIGDPVDGKFVIYTTRDSGDTWQRWANSETQRPAEARPHESVFAASNSAVVVPGKDGGPFTFVTGGSSGSRLFFPKEHSPFDVRYWWAFNTIQLPFKSNESSGGFSLASRTPLSPYSDLMVVGGDYNDAQSTTGTSFFIPSSRPLLSKGFSSPSTPPHGYRSSVAYDPTQKLWITVGPNGTDISRDDGKNWTPLKPSGYDPPDADKNWNALSLPFVVGPHGRIGRLRTISNPSK
jgi:hypothetical protein